MNGNGTQSKGRNRASYRLRHLFFEASPLPTECMLAFMAVLIGVTFLLPLNTYSLSIVYQVLALIAPEPVVGSFLFGWGLVCFFVAFNGGARLRFNMATGNLVIYTFLFVVFVVSSPGSLTNMLVAPALASWWVTMRLRGERDE